MTQKHSLKVMQHFEQKAAEYDAFMQKAIPDYCEMLDSLIGCIPYDTKSELRICDLGSGTGNATAMLARMFPNATIKCVDISPTMTDMAKAKLNSPNISFDVADFGDYEFTEKYDLIISSIALHHLESDADKKAFYKRIYYALKQGGVFYNADIVLAASDFMEEKNMQQWKSWLRLFHSEEELMELVIDRYHEEDRPTHILNHLTWMQEVGFKNLDVIWKKNKGAVYGGYR